MTQPPYGFAKNKFRKSARLEMGISTILASGTISHMKESSSGIDYFKMSLDLVCLYVWDNDKHFPLLYGT